MDNINKTKDYIKMKTEEVEKSFEYCSNFEFKNKLSLAILDITSDNNQMISKLKIINEDIDYIEKKLIPRYEKDILHLNEQISNYNNLLYTISKIKSKEVEEYTTEANETKARYIKEIQMIELDITNFKEIIFECVTSSAELGKLYHQIVLLLKICNQKLTNFKN